MDIIVIILLLFLLVGVTILQVFLSTRPSKGLGLILPISFFILILLIFFTFSLTGFGAISTIGIIFFNIPSLVFLIIYFICKNLMTKKSNNKEINKMNIIDLE